MANPNIASATSILGNTVYGSLSTSLTEVLENAAGSNTIVKVNSVVISNVDGTNAADVTDKIINCKWRIICNYCSFNYGSCKKLI